LQEDIRWYEYRIDTLLSSGLLPQQATVFRTLDPQQLEKVTCQWRQERERRVQELRANPPQRWGQTHERDNPNVYGPEGVWRYSEKSEPAFSAPESEVTTIPPPPTKC